MQGAVARQKGAAVYHPDLPVREHFLQPLPGHFILWRSRARDKNPSVDYEEIGV